MFVGKAVHCYRCLTAEGCPPCIQHPFLGRPLFAGSFICDSSQGQVRLLASGASQAAGSRTRVRRPLRRLPEPVSPSWSSRTRSRCRHGAQATAAMRPASRRSRRPPGSRAPATTAATRQRAGSRSGCRTVCVRCAAASTVSCMSSWRCIGTGAVAHSIDQSLEPALGLPCIVRCCLRTVLVTNQHPWLSLRGVVKFGTQQVNRWNLSNGKCGFENQMKPPI